MFKLTPKNISHFWMNVIKKENNCWEWQSSLTKSGYGRFSIDGKTYRAHRISYYFFNGEFDNEKVICHHCDNPKCVNPDHLFLGTMKENCQDRDKKGRYKDPGKHRGSYSKYRGVYYDARCSGKRWRVIVTVNYQRFQAGRFDTEMEAAEKYDEIVRELNKVLPDNKKRKLNF